MHIIEVSYRCCHTLSNLHHRDVVISDMHFLYLICGNGINMRHVLHDVLISFYLVYFVQREAGDVSGSTVKIK